MVLTEDGIYIRNWEDFDWLPIKITGRGDPLSVHVEDSAIASDMWGNDEIQNTISEFNEKKAVFFDGIRIQQPDLPFGGNSGIFTKIFSEFSKSLQAFSLGTIIDQVCLKGFNLNFSN